MTSAPAKIIDGRALARQIRHEVKAQIIKLKLHPGLAVILVGENPASRLYVALKQKAAHEAGIIFSLYKFSATAPEAEILETINWLNADKEINAIIVQLPLPAHLDEQKIISAISPAKDVDGFHPENRKKLLANEVGIIPGLDLGILQLIQSTGQDMTGKQALIIARSPEFTSTLSHLLNQFSITNTIISPDNNTWPASVPGADIVITAIGAPRVITGDMLKPGAIVIDVGTNHIDANTVVGDVDWDSCAKVASWITPVPGGIGPMTVAMLLKNTVALTRMYKML